MSQPRTARILYRAYACAPSVGDPLQPAQQSFWERQETDLLVDGWFFEFNTDGYGKAAVCPLSQGPRRFEYVRLARPSHGVRLVQ